MRVDVQSFGCISHRFISMEMRCESAMFNPVMRNKTVTVFGAPLSLTRPLSLSVAEKLRKY